MNRLTELVNGKLVVVGMNANNFDEKLLECVKRLYEYEETEVTPEEIERTKWHTDGYPENDDEDVLIECSGKVGVNIEMDHAYQLASHSDSGWLVDAYVGSLRHLVVHRWREL